MGHKLELRILHDNVNGCIRRRNEALEKKSDDIGDIRSECQEATRKGNFGTRHTTLRRKRTGDSKPNTGTTLSTREFENTSKRHQGQIRTGQLVTNVPRMPDMTRDQRHIKVKEKLHEEPPREDTVKLMKEVNESALRKDGVRIRYIHNACSAVREEAHH